MCERGLEIIRMRSVCGFVQRILRCRGVDDARACDCPCACLCCAVAPEPLVPASRAFDMGKLRSVFIGMFDSAGGFEYCADD